jgi:hypothetical protein
MDASRSALVTVAHDREDVLRADDAVSLVLAARRERRVLLVSEGSAFLERALGAVPGVRVRRVSAGEFVRMVGNESTGAVGPRAGRPWAWGGEGDGVDVIVFDGYSPGFVPSVATLSFDAAPPIEGLRVAPAGEDDAGPAYLLDWSRDHALLRHVALQDVLVQRAGTLALPDDARVLATGERGPVLAVVEREGVPHVVASFSLLNTNWPMQVGFAVFMDNALSVLTSGDDAGQSSYRPGGVAVIEPVASDADLITYDGPVSMSASADAGRATLPMFERAGVYRTDAAVPPAMRVLPVNMLDAGESDIRPAGELIVGREAVRVMAGADGPVRREAWRWFAGIALVVLAVEWIVYARRVRV